MVSRPHGGRLIRRVASHRERQRLLEEKREMPSLEVRLEVATDVENIAYGVFSPLEGFLNSEDYEYVLSDMRLSDDTPWTIPIVLDISAEDKGRFSEGDTVLLTYRGEGFAILDVEEIYGWDKKKHAAKVYKTTDPAHPGVEKTYQMKDYLVGGKILLLKNIENSFERYTLRPAETRVLFREKGWRNIVGFQTRNPPHLGHEYVQKSALTFMDGLFINPLVGWKKKGDYRDEVIISAYEALIQHYYPKGAVVFSVTRTPMRYAGPREAIHHAIMRKNYGCTHFIVGRDHAGVGNFYGPYEAHEIFKEFPDLGIQPLFVKEFFFCRRCGGIVNEKICPHPKEERIYISGTKIRGLIREGKMPPETMMRPEVAKVILGFDNPFIE